MKKNILSLMGILLVFALAACGNQAGGNASQDSQAESGSAETENTEGLFQQQEEVRSETPSENSATEPEAESGKTLVVYYSASGNTETVTGYIADSANADLFELVPVNPYSEADLNWRDSDSRVVHEHDNPDDRHVVLVETMVSDWDSYDTVFIGFPIWWGIAAWPVDAFIEANDFTGKTVIPFCTSSSSGLGESGELLEEAAGTGKWLDGGRFSSRPSEETVRDWVEGLGL